MNGISFVGSIIRKQAIQQIGLPMTGFFIWYDDTEYGLRLSEIGKVLCVPGIRVQHDTVEYKNEVTWKDYYGTRNFGLTIKLHFSRLNFLWYCFFTYVKSYIRVLIKNKPAKGRLERAAIKDAICGKEGLNKVFKPGWHA